MNREEVVSYFIKKGMLIGPDIFDKLGSNIQNEEDLDAFVFNNKFLFSTNELDSKNNGTTLEIDNEVLNSEEATIMINKEETKTDFGNVKIVASYEYKNKKKDVQDFVNYFKKRYESLKKILLYRAELQESISIARLARKQERESVSLIGIVIDKSQTKNDNIKLVLEDPTGTYQVLVTKNKEETYNLAKDIVLDEVIGLTGVLGQKIVFCNSLYFPEIPINHELKKSPDEVYAVFISDIHFGIKNFLGSDFMKFILWIKGEYGNDQQRNIASKVKYLFVTGDIVKVWVFIQGKKKI